MLKLLWVGFARVVRYSIALQSHELRYATLTEAGAEADTRAGQQTGPMWRAITWRLPTASGRRQPYSRAPSPFPSILRNSTAHP
jgi:hypothetical protein